MDMDEDGYPFVKVRLIKPKRDNVWQWQLLKCPYCGGKHLHGAGDNPDRVNAFLGHRVAHCDDPSGKGYILTLGEVTMR